mmetsp:Transcript_42245/g.117637  ORF Transcript_42245/g.117637 Transcript_42245/m.117637 type:complete len:294 (+) Transcript_42245:539-1420(+)
MVDVHGCLDTPGARLQPGEVNDGACPQEELPMTELPDRPDTQPLERRVGSLRQALERRRRQLQDLVQRLALMLLVQSVADVHPLARRWSRRRAWTRRQLGPPGPYTWRRRLWCPCPWRLPCRKPGKVGVHLLFGVHLVLPVHQDADSSVESLHFGVNLLLAVSLMLLVHRRGICLAADGRLTAPVGLLVELAVHVVLVCLHSHERVQLCSSHLVLTHPLDKAPICFSLTHQLHGCLVGLLLESGAYVGKVCFGLKFGVDVRPARHCVHVRCVCFAMQPAVHVADIGLLCEPLL